LIFDQSFSLREKVAVGRMRGKAATIPLTLTLSLRERGLFET